jgi:hypothetical protein
VHSALPYLTGRVREIGFDPGHLQLLLNKKTPASELDESRQMAQ